MMINIIWKEVKFDNLLKENKILLNVGEKTFEIPLEELFIKNRHVE